MKNIIIILSLLLLVGCGYSSRGNEMVGQVKKIAHFTPLLCPEYSEVNISLGVFRNGIGYLSIEDVWVHYGDKDHEKIVKEAHKTGKLVKITYDVERLSLCAANRVVTKIELLGD